nr:hypothetical protein CFP56_59630 [Quercus suber]
MSSRYPPSDYRPPRDRSRSPPRFDRRASSANVFENRPPPPPRITSDAPRGPRSQFDASRAPPGAGPSPTTPASRPAFSSLRDAPPLGSSDRARPFRERDDYRRDRPPSPRERSPARPFKNSRDYPPRDIDVGRPRRGSRDGPLSAGATYPDSSSFAPGSFGGRGGFNGRGRGRVEFEAGRGRGVRRNLDDRDLFRRDRSPPPRWGRDLSRDGREPERRDDRRFERRDDDRRPEWAERDRETTDRGRRDQPPLRPEPRQLNGSPHSATGSHAGSQAPPIDPGRLALIEGSSADVAARRQSVPQNAAPPPRREVPETPSYLNGRADATANRYNQRGSSPPTQAPPVPAFTLSFAPTGPAAASSTSNTSSSKPPRPKSAGPSDDVPVHEHTRVEKRVEPPVDAPVAPKAQARAPLAPKAQLAEPPPSAPRAPRALEVEPAPGPHGRLQGVRSMESLAGSRAPPSGPSFPRASMPPRSSSTAQAVAVSTSSLATLTQPVSPNVQQVREFSAPTGPRATRISPAPASVSPRPAFASPRSEAASFQRNQTPPPPSGPRRRSISVSPKVPASSVPTAPKADRIPPTAPRGGPMTSARATDRPGGPQSWAVPSAPRNLQWNQWKRPLPPESKLVPAKRDSAGEEKDRQVEVMSSDVTMSEASPKMQHDSRQAQIQDENKMQIDSDTNPPAHSAKQSFFGQPMETTEPDEVSDAADVEDIMSSSEDEGLDVEDEALFNAKFEKRKRELEAKLVDLSAREYRATTPLECIARLARISIADLQRANENQEMDVDETNVAKGHRRKKPPTQNSDSDANPDAITPTQEEDDTRVQIRDGGDDGPEHIRYVRRPSPEIINLPYLTKTPQPLFKSEPLVASSLDEVTMQAAVYDALRDDMGAISSAQADCEQDFLEKLRTWRAQCAKLDREQEEHEKVERQKSMEPLPEMDAPLASINNAGSESRRLHKFSSEYIIEQVLKQSEETARMEQEKLDRKAKKVQADMEKEALLPDLLSVKEVRSGVYIDSNRYRDPDSLPMVFSYLPPDDTFTDNERQIFVAAFKETPKKWGEIASLLPGRTYRDCIHHYYANKWDNRFKDRTKGKARGGPGRGRGRGGKSALRGRGAAAMADLNRNEPVAPPSVSDSGRPKRAAAPTTFGERETDLKTTPAGPSPVKKLGLAAKSDGTGEPEKKKRKGEKPGRKPKSQQPLAALAAAPITSPSKSYLPTMQSKEEIVRAQNLADANLLAGLHSGHHHPMMVPAEGQLSYAVHDTFAQPPLPIEEAARSKPIGPGALSKSNASSYWSVPEQTDFAKYIAHFGTDFASIAAHMGTKTQTMIKNHYQRQVESGNKAELEASAKDADHRRKNGEDMGAPPTPTPIVKRKYENPQSNAPRTLAPHKNATAMEIDETPPQSRIIPSKHTSPPQFVQQPRFTTTAQSAPVTAPSPLPTAAVLQHTPHAQPITSARPMQHSLSSRISFLSDTMPDARTTLQQTGQPLRMLSEANNEAVVPTPLPARSQPSLEMMRDLKAEQDRAFRVQQEQSQQERIGLHRQMPMHHETMQLSPATQPRIAPPLERQGSTEESASSASSRAAFAGSGLASLSRPQSSQPIFGLGSMGLGSSLSNRSPFRQAQIKREDSRPSSVPAVPLPTIAPPVPAPEPPKRSNLMSILNSEPEAAAPPPKRETPSVAPLRTHSPAPRLTAFSQSSTPAPLLDHSSRRDTRLQSPMAQHAFAARPPFQHSGDKAASHHSQPPPLNHELSSGGLPNPQPSKPDWASHVHQRPSQSGQSARPPLDGGDLRSSIFSHRSSALSPLHQPMRGNPSPPPNAMLGHSRTSSLNAQSSQAPRDSQRPGLAIQQPQHQAHSSAQPMQPGSYGSQSGGPFHQHPPEMRNHAQQSHNGAITAGFALPGGHHRGVSRDDLMRHEQAFAQRDREEHEWRRRQQEDAERRESQFRHDQERQQHQQHQQQQSQQQSQQAFGRSLPPAMQPSFEAPAPFGQNRPSFGLRETSLREVQSMVAEQTYIEEANRRRLERIMMEREQEAAADYRRRHDEPGFRRTPLGGGNECTPKALTHRIAKFRSSAAGFGKNKNQNKNLESGEGGSGMTAVAGDGVSKRKEKGKKAGSSKRKRKVVQLDEQEVGEKQGDGLEDEEIGGKRMKVKLEMAGDEF